MAYTPSLIANALLVKARQERKPLTHMGLQKLVYFVHCWALTLGKSGYSSEDPQPWEYGPLFESLYYRLVARGDRHVKDLLEIFDAKSGERRYLVPSSEDDEFYGVLDQVWKEYGRFSALELSAMAHAAGSPWAQARVAKLGIIPHEMIVEFFSRLVQETSRAA